jgi:hypothetical protein
MLRFASERFEQEDSTRQGVKSFIKKRLVFLMLSFLSDDKGWAAKGRGFDDWESSIDYTYFEAPVEMSSSLPLSTYVDYLANRIYEFVQLEEKSRYPLYTEYILSKTYI